MHSLSYSGSATFLNPYFPSCSWVWRLLQDWFSVSLSHRLQRPRSFVQYIDGITMYGHNHKYTTLFWLSSPESNQRKLALSVVKPVPASKSRLIQPTSVRTFRISLLDISQCLCNYRKLTNHLSEMKRLVPECWTDWFDRDNPSGTGDWETLSDLRTENPGKICPKPFGIEATTLTGVSVAAAGDVIFK